MKIIKKIIGAVKKLFRFLTGLGFYGFGLLGIAIVCWFVLKGGFWNTVGHWFAGAFVFKNYKAIIDWFDKKVF